MRIFKILILALTLAFLSTPAWGDGASPDPTIVVQPGHGSTDTETGEAQSDPLVVLDGSGVTDWILQNPVIAANGELFVEVVAYPGENLSYFNTEQWQCASDPPTTTSCFFVQTMGSNTDGYEFVFYGPFTENEDIGISVPEPGTVLLLFVGLALLFAFGLKKRQAILA